jgi:hypothetical protein
LKRVQYVENRFVTNRCVGLSPRRNRIGVQRSASGYASAVGPGSRTSALKNRPRTGSGTMTILCDYCGEQTASIKDPLGDNMCQKCFDERYENCPYCGELAHVDTISERCLDKGKYYGPMEGSYPAEYETMCDVCYEKWLNRRYPHRHKGEEQ